MKQTIKYDKETGIRTLYRDNKPTQSCIVPWVTGGWACFVNGQLAVVQKRLADANKFIKAAG